VHKRPASGRGIHAVRALSAGAIPPNSARSSPDRAVPHAGFVYAPPVEDAPYRRLCIDEELSAACTADVPPTSEPTPTPVAQPERARAGMRPLRLGSRSPTSVPHPFPSWAPAVATVVPHRLRHIVEVMRHIELDWLMSASMPCDLVPDVDDPAVELAVMILDG